MENKLNKIFCVADIHGGHKALVQCLERSGFNKEEDTLICLGDTADGFLEVPECFEELLSIKNLIYILGNHDYWLLQYFKFDSTPHIWTSQGGKSTLESYEKLKNMMDWHQINRHQKLLEEAKDYYIQGNKVFVHGGFNWRVPIDEQSLHDLMWDRSMFKIALEWNKGELRFPVYDEIYIGHTSTELAPHFNRNFEGKTEPLFLANLIAMDTGGGWSGKLTIINVETKEYFQSDLVKELYPEAKGR